jgi:hypothetical protein
LSHRSKLCGLTTGQSALSYPAELSEYVAKAAQIKLCLVARTELNTCTSKSRGTERIELDLCQPVHDLLRLSAISVSCLLSLFGTGQSETASD